MTGKTRRRRQEARPRAHRRRRRPHRRPSSSTARLKTRARTALEARAPSRTSDSKRTTPCSFAPKRSPTIIKKQIQNYEKAALTTETGTVLSVGDGIARIYGLEGAMAGELLEFPGNLMGLVLNLEADNVGAALLRRRRRTSRKARSSSARAASSTCRSARRSSAASSTRSACPIDGKGPIETPHRRRVEIKAPGILAAPAGQGAAADGHQGHRRDGPHRPRPARAHHRRPADRQDRRRDRHDHQPEGQGRLLLLRRHRPEAVDRRQRRRQARRSSARWSTRPSSSRARARWRRCSSSRRTPA